MSFFQNIILKKMHKTADATNYLLEELNWSSSTWREERMSILFVTLNLIWSHVCSITKNSNFHLCNVTCFYLISAHLLLNPFRTCLHHFLIQLFQYSDWFSILQPSINHKHCSKYWLMEEAADLGPHTFPAIVFKHWKCSCLCVYSYVINVSWH